MKRKRKLKKSVKVIFFLIVVLIMSLNAILGTNKRRTTEIRTNTQVETNISENVVKMENNGIPKICGLSTITCDEEEKTNYRLTSYYTNDPTGSGEYVGAGIHTSKFQVNEKGWYTYKGKLVLAGATNECLNSTSGACNKWNIPRVDKQYFNYYDEIKVIIDEVEYDAVILDSCGACMYLEENRIDLFVSNKGSSIDRGYRGVNEIKVVNK